MGVPIQPSSSSQPAEPELRGIGGWLLFFIISVTILAPIGFLRNFVEEIGVYSYSQNSILQNVLIIEWVVRGVVLLLGIYAGINLWRIRSRAVRLTKVYLVMVIIQQIVVTGLLIWASSLSGANRDATNEQIGMVLLAAILTIILAVVWYLYFVKSERVAATYTAS